MDKDKYYVNNFIEPDYYLPRGMDLPEEYRKELPLEEIFNRQAPLIVEVGFGNGEFLVNLAKTYPQKNFLGIELSKLSILKLQALVSKHNISNIRYIFMDAKVVFKYLLPPSSVEEVYINFPDPWPKKRHHKHRFIQEDNIKLLLKALIPGGKIRFVTDDTDYSLWAYHVFSNFVDLKNLYFPLWYRERVEDFFLTKYARKWLAMGKRFYFHLYEKKLIS